MVFLILLGLSLWQGGGCVSHSRFTTEHGGRFTGFCISSTEHLIVEVPEPIVVRSVKGTVVNQEGADPERFPSYPLPEVLFEIRGPGKSERVRGATTDKKGRFRIKDVAEGEYAFKATLNAFQSVVGTIRVTRRAPRDATISIRMKFGV